MAMEPSEMREIQSKFKVRYPRYQGLNIRQMKQVLDGELVIVDVRGKSKFELWKAEDMWPGGKFDKRQAMIREWNRAMRAENRARREAFEAKYGVPPKDDPKAMGKYIEDFFKKYFLDKEED